MADKPTLSNKPISKKSNIFIKFSSLAIQMGVVIGGAVWLGIFLDNSYNPGGKAWTVSLALFGVCASMYLIIKEVINISKND